MNSRTTRAFWDAYRKLPAELRSRAKADFGLFVSNPFHGGLQFKRVGNRRDVWSARVGDDYRVLGLRVQPDVIIWYWIGSHADYDLELKRLR